MPDQIKRRIQYSFGLLLVAVAALFFLLLPGEAERRSNRLHGDHPVPVSQAARVLHEELLVVDLHADTLLWKRGLLDRSTRGHVDLPRLLAGNVALQAFTVATKVPWGLNIERNDDRSDSLTLLAVSQLWPPRTWGSLKARALHQAAQLRDAVARSDGRLTLVTSAAELSSYLDRRRQDPGQTAAILGIEGAHALEGDPANLDELFEAGFRMIGLVHFFDNSFAGSAHGLRKGGLTDQGRELVRRMESRGVTVDLAHASPQLIEEVLALATRPVLVSHTGVRGTCDNRRNLSDEQIRGIARTGGVIGIGFWETAVCGTDAHAMVRAIRHVADLVGVEYVGLGSDYDGAVTVPFDAAGMAQITEALLAAQFTEREIRQIMGENTLRVLARNLP